MASSSLHHPNRGNQFNGRLSKIQDGVLHAEAATGRLTGSASYRLQRWQGQAAAVKEFPEASRPRRTLTASGLMHKVNFCACIRSQSRKSDPYRDAQILCTFSGMIGLLGRSPQWQLGASSSSDLRIALGSRSFRMRASACAIASALTSALATLQSISPAPDRYL